MKQVPNRIIAGVEEDPSQFEILRFPCPLPCILTLCLVLGGIWT
jgi:hypothetical protein